MQDSASAAPECCLIVWTIQNPCTCAGTCAIQLLESGQSAASHGLMRSRRVDRADCTHMIKSKSYMWEGRHYCLRGIKDCHSARYNLWNKRGDGRICHPVNVDAGSRVDVALAAEHGGHVGLEGGRLGAGLRLAEGQHVARAGRAVALTDGVQEGDEVLTHAGRQLLRQPKVQQDLRISCTLYRVHRILICVAQFTFVDFACAVPTMDMRIATSWHHNPAMWRTEHPSAVLAAMLLY